jgi:metal-sulfur cluster biosynthetic enzyme
MMLTSMFCPLSTYLVAAVKSAVENVEGISQVNVKVVGYGLPPAMENSD